MRCVCVCLCVCVYEYEEDNDILAYTQSNSKYPYTTHTCIYIHIYLPSLSVEKSSTESMNRMSAPAMKLSGLAEMSTAAFTLGSLATFSCFYFFNLMCVCVYTCMSDMCVWPNNQSDMHPTIPPLHLHLHTQTLPQNSPSTRYLSPA